VEEILDDDANHSIYHRPIRGLLREWACFLKFAKYDFADCFAAYQHFATAYSNLPTIGDCAGGEDAALFGCGLLTSYLFLFINFYFQTYKKKPQANGKANGHANGKVYVVQSHFDGNILTSFFSTKAEWMIAGSALPWCYCIPTGFIYL
jgi:hypothetical protein